MSSSSVKIVSRLLQVISKQLPLKTAETLLDKNLSSYMDGKKVGSNKNSWFRWVQFLHYNLSKKVSSPKIIIEEIKEKGKIIEVTAYWSGQVNSSTKKSSLGKVTYQVQNSKIINIWTHRANYSFIYGKKIAASKIYFYWIILKMLLWKPAYISSK